MTYKAVTVLESSKPKPSVRHLFQSNNNSTTDYTYLYLLIGTIFFCVIFVSGFGYFIYKRRTNKENQEKKKEQEIANKSITTSLSLVKGTNTTSVSTNATLVGTENAYSIPGFLQLKSNDIHIMKQLTKGGQGTISIAEILNPEFINEYQTKQVIIKSTGKNFEQLSERKQRIFNQELSIIHYFNKKPGFVRLYGYNLEPACLVLKIYQFGSMDNLIAKRGYFQSTQITKKFIAAFIKEICHALYLMHEAGFVHCDIKSQNILLDVDQNNTLHPVLTDFGLSQVVSDKVLKVSGMSVENWRGFSVNYAAPEQIYEALARYSDMAKPEIVKKRDIFAIPGLIYALIMKKEPWQKYI